MLSEHIVAADAATIRRGVFVNLTGVAVEIEGNSEFREQYFAIINSFKEKYAPNLLRSVLKSEDILKLIPSYNLKQAHSELTEELLQIENIRTINVTNTTLSKDVFAWDGSSTTGLIFLKNTLQQYYPIIPVWRYYLKNPNPAKHVALDGITGKITKAWQFVGKKADVINIVPYGDLTYPCISLCDIICGYIRNTVHHIDEKEIYRQLKDVTHAYVTTEFIGDDDIEYFNIKYPHSLKTELHLPHPLFLIRKSKDIDSKIVRDADFFQLLLRHVEKKGGAVCFEDFLNQQPILKKGDCIICLDSKEQERMRYAEILNPSKEIKVLNIEETYKVIEDEAKQMRLNR